ncbi:MAG: arylsulfatase [Paenibacillus sp.]|jgi:arylsulfatase A-like enzyme|nr:arylsulfatase [Paenibacillus sp.]
MSTRSSEARPNILLIMTDQQRGDCLGAEGHPVLLTPNMDGIGAGGARFSSCYSSCPVCIPARRSLLSGQFPPSHGLAGNHVGEWNVRHTLPSVLREAGYHTYWAGRDMHQHPPRKRFGFDHMVIMSDYRRQLDRLVPVDTFNPLGDYYSSGILANDWTARTWHLDESLHMTNWATNEALRFLQNRDPSCPFFLAVSYLAPHPPLVPPAFYFERYIRQATPEPYIGEWAQPPEFPGAQEGGKQQRVRLTGEALASCRAAYHAAINHVDDQIRRLLYNLDVERTVVMFTSDHGEMLGDHHLWWKGVPYEGSARVPLLIRAPSRFGIKRGSVIDAPVALEDIMPTVLEFAGADIPDTVEGRSLLPLLRQENVAWRRHVHIEHSVGTMSDEALAHHTLTDGKEKYIWFAATGEEQFFDLVRDPHECRSLLDDEAYAERVAAWRSEMVRELHERPGGFSDGTALIPGRPYPPDIYVHS